MGRVFTGVTIEIFSDVVREAHLSPSDKFTLVLEEKSNNRHTAIKNIRAISSAVSAEMAKDGIVTEVQKEEFLKDIAEGRYVESSGNWEQDKLKMSQKERDGWC